MWMALEKIKENKLIIAEYLTHTFTNIIVLCQYRYYRNRIRVASKLYVVSRDVYGMSLLSPLMRKLD